MRSPERKRPGGEPGRGIKSAGEAAEAIRFEVYRIARPRHVVGSAVCRTT